MDCPICKGNQWKNVDRYRLKPHDMEMCKGCGFVSYPKNYKNKEQVLEYYRGEYRGGAPNMNNLTTGQTKLAYHADFLKDLIGDWIKEDKTDPVITDVGGAIGMFAHWWKTIQKEGGGLAFPDADINGVELTTTFRRVAYHEYGIELKEEFDESKQYDLITHYKVLEHMFDPDQALQVYKRCLKPGGKLYLAVPVWFEKMSNFGISGWDIEYYYHKDHCNVWTRPHFEKMIRDAGFKILKENHWTYDSAYLLEVGEETRPEIELPGPKQVEEALARVKAADDAFRAKDWEGAVKLWPRFPVARRAVYEHNRAAAHKLGYKGIIEQYVQPWLDLEQSLCGDALAFAADIASRYNAFDDALQALKKLLEVRPGSADAYQAMGNVYRMMAKAAKTPEDRIEMLKSARVTAQHMKGANIGVFAQAVTWIYNDSAEIPIPGE